MPFPTSPNYIGSRANKWEWERSLSLLHLITHLRDFFWCLSHSLGLGDLKVLVTKGEMLPVRKVVMFHVTES